MADRIIRPAILTGLVAAIAGCGGGTPKGPPPPARFVVTGKHAMPFYSHGTTFRDADTGHEYLMVVSGSNGSSSIVRVK